MKKAKFESELSVLDELMQRDLKKKERKQIVERLQDLIKRVDKYADRGKLPKEAALRIRIDLLHLIKQLKNNDQDKESSRNRVHDLVQHVFSMYQSRPKSKHGADTEEKLMILLFRSFK
jgi:hypothetical protein